MYYVYRILVLSAVWASLCLESVLPCGGVASGRKGEIKTPNFRGEYNNNLNCIWTIQVDEDDTIVVEFHEFHVETSRWFGVDCADNFFVYDGSDSMATQLLQKTCGVEKPERFYSSGNALMMVLQTDGSTTWKGVHLTWKVSDKFSVKSERQTWEDASKHCQNEGGHLAVRNEINDPLILKHLNGITESLWIGEYLTPWIWLMGCYEDQHQTLLNVKTFTETRENEAKVCQYICREFVYFGLQGVRCFCLTSEDMENITFVRTSENCKTECPGNNEEKCGGMFALTVYMNDVCWTNSSDWTAKVTRTISGRRCQAWSSNSPHAHSFHKDHMFPDGSEAAASNYCRDPDGKGAPWCFTEDPKVSWQFCDAPPCPGTCWKDPIQYSGHLNVTMEGAECRAWADDPPPNNTKYHDPTKFPDESVYEASNYCRSPDDSPFAWCYLKDLDNWDWDTCGSPPCFDNADVEETGGLCRLFWSKDSKVFFKVHSCNEPEYYSCFVDDTYSEILMSATANSPIYPDKANFFVARNVCRLKYSMSNYKTLFGLLSTDWERIRRRHWLGNFRGEDIMLNKDAVPTPSSCKSIKRMDETGMKTDFQSSCDQKLGYICQTDAVLCGAKFYNDSGNISSPGYPENYEDNEFCLWEINVSDEKVIEIMFSDVDVENSSCCCFDYIEILDASATPSRRIAKLCGQMTNFSVTTESNKLLIKFNSDSKINNTGFRLDWTSDIKTTSTLVTTTLVSTSTKIYVTSDEMSSAKETRTTTNKIEELKGNDQSSMKGGPLAGIIVGVLLAVSLLIVLLVCLLTRRRRQTKNPSPVAFELQQDIDTRRTSGDTEPKQPDVYSTPTNNAHEDLQKQNSKECVRTSPDDNTYDHLHQSADKKAQLGSGNSYEKTLVAPDVYDHIPDSKKQQSAETYDHLMGTSTSIEDDETLENEYDVTSTSHSKGHSLNDIQATYNYLTPIGESYQTKDNSKSADTFFPKDPVSYETKALMEDDMYYNVPGDDQRQRTPESDQNVYEINETE